MKKYLDYSGLLTLWNRIKAVFVTRAELEEDEEVIATALTDLNTRLDGSATIDTNQTIAGDKTFTGAVALGSGATATTPAITDNDTSVATTAFVHNVVNNMTGADVEYTGSEPYFLAGGITVDGALDMLDSAIGSVSDNTVSRPSSATDNAVVRFDGTQGNIQNSGVTINDSNHVTAAKFITSGGTSSLFVKGDGSLSNEIDGSNINGYIAASKNAFLASHPESANGVLVPYLYNDLAFLTSQGGSATVYSTTDTDLTAAALTVKTNWDNVDSINDLFDASFAYWSGGNNNATEMNQDGLIIDITLPRLFTYGNKFYIDFGQGSWGFQKIDILVMNSTYDTVYTSKVSSGDIFGSVVYYKFGLSHTTTNPSTNASVSGFNRLRIHLYTRTYTYGVRIAQIGLVNYSSIGHRYPTMSRGFDDPIYRSITPNTANTYDLGTSTKYWKNVYANNLILKNGTSSQFLKGDGSLDSAEYINSIQSINDGSIILNNFQASPTTSVLKGNLYISKLDNSLYSSHLRYVVTHKVFSSTDDSFLRNINVDIFNMNYDQSGEPNRIFDGEYAELYIGTVAESELTTSSPYLFVYGGGTLIFSFYGTDEWCPTSISCKIFDKYSDRGWQDLTIEKSGKVYLCTTNSVYPCAIKLTYTGQTGTNKATCLVQCEWFRTRSTALNQSVVTKYPIKQDLYGDIEAPKFIKRGGTSSQFLKADGSVDSNTYASTTYVLNAIQGILSGDTNVIETVKVNGTALTPDANKAVDISVPPGSFILDIVIDPESENVTINNNQDSGYVAITTTDLDVFTAIDNAYNEGKNMYVKVTIDESSILCSFEGKETFNSNVTYRFNSFHMEDPHLEMCYLVFIDNSGLITIVLLAVNIPEKYKIINHGTKDTGTSNSPYQLTFGNMHVWGTVTSLNLSLQPSYTDYVVEYMFEFISGSTPTTLSLPSTVEWDTDKGPINIESGYMYLVSIVGNLALWARKEVS